MPDSSKIYRFGKFIAVEYPDVYFEFVRKLHKEHPDLIQAMVLTQVKMEDGTALEFLNMILGTNITKMTPMELGYAELLDKLNQRSKTIITTNKALDVAAKQISDTFLGFKRHESEQGGPVFPSIEEMEEKGMKPQ